MRKCDAELSNQCEIFSQVIQMDTRNTYSCCVAGRHCVNILPKKCVFNFSRKIFAVTMAIESAIRIGTALHSN